MIYGIGIYWFIYVYVYVIYLIIKICMYVDIIILSNYIIKSVVFNNWRWDIYCSFF